ncbi:MAG: PilW family protein [Gammaproteobacteria bacterium]|nr:PilW family protein [Gammaproteobacteria bacterium]
MKASIPLWVSRHQRGIGLVEIMVTLAVGLALMGGVLQVFLSNKQTYRMQEAHARLQENGRFAMEKLSRDIREAGYWGCASRSVSASLKNILDLAPLTTSDKYFYDFTRTIVEGFEWTGSWTGNPDSPAIVIGNVFQNAVNGNDVLTVRAPLGPSIRVTAPMASSSDDPSISANNELNQNDIVMVSDCTSATIMQVTDASPQTAGPLQHMTGSGTPGNSILDLGTAYGNDAEVAEIGTVSYYVSDGGSGGLPGLYQREGNNNAEELIEGVENMQILYGEDTNDDFSANRYLPANSVGDWANVISVRLSLVLMTLEDNLTASAQTYQFNGAPVTAPDRRLRRVFTSTIGIRNRLAN